jgi:hypothetical protein
MNATCHQTPLNGQLLTDEALGALRTSQKKRPPRHRAGERFLKGPIPWRWIEQACPLPGKALAVALLLWKEAGCERTNAVRFRVSQAVALGFHPDTARRGLSALESAGLVTVRYVPGRCLEVTLLEATDDRNRA